jgi:hypothetical protein
MQKTSILLLLLLFIVPPAITQNVGIGTSTPDGSAKLDVTSTNSGLLPPRMTTAQRDAIANPALGLMIVNITTGSVEFFDGTSWLNLASAVQAATGIKKMYGGSIGDFAYDIQQTTDGGYIIAGNTTSSNTGTFSGIVSNGPSDCMVIKTDVLGNIEWQLMLGGSATDFAKSIQQTTDGGFILTGYSTSSNTGTVTGVTSNGGSDYLIIKLSSTGSIQWQKLLGGLGQEEPGCIKQTTDGGYIVVGYSTSSNTGTLTGFVSNGGHDCWVVKLDGNGNVEWQKLLGGTLNDDATSVQQTTDGGYIIGCTSASSNTGTLTGMTNNGSDDYWIIKLNGSGVIQWQKLLGGSLSDQCNSIRATADGGCIIGGNSGSSNTGTLTGFTNNGSIDYWIIKMDGLGNVQWQKLFGGADLEFLATVELTTDGNYIVAGVSASSNTGTLTGIGTSGGNDIWVIKLNVSGNILWQKLLGGANSDGIGAIRPLRDGGYILAGGTTPSTAGIWAGLPVYGNQDCYLLKLDKNGNPR